MARAFQALWALWVVASVFAAATATPRRVRVPLVRRRQRKVGEQGEGLSGSHVFSGAIPESLSLSSRSVDNTQPEDRVKDYVIKMRDYYNMMYTGSVSIGNPPQEFRVQCAYRALSAHHLSCVT